MNILDFVGEGYMIIIAVLYVIGIFIKQTDFIKDKYIPVSLMLVGIVCSLFLEYEISNAVFQGILCAGVAVLGNETIKQLNKKE